MSDDWGQWIDVRKKLNARIREQQALLDECEQLIARITHAECSHDWCKQSRATLAKLRGQEKTDD